jgi:OmpA-OmpF porin, OOP family
MSNKIKKIISMFSVVLGMAILASAPVYAKIGSAVRDSNGGKVIDSSGNCVRTQWMTDVDECRTGRVQVTREAINEIMKMEERIVYFNFDKHDVKDSEKDKLDTLADALKSHNVKVVKVVGYTDRIGTKNYNKTLSIYRANAVKHYLNSKVKLDSSIVQLRGLGDEDQVKGCENIKQREELIDCLSPNRRVEIEVDYYDNMK